MQEMTLISVKIALKDLKFGSNCNIHRILIVQLSEHKSILIVNFNVANLF